MGVHSPSRADSDPEDAVRQAVEQLGPGAVVSRTDHFVLVSDCEPTWTNERGVLLERAMHQFRRFADKLGVDVAPAGTRLLCVLINDHDRYEKFAREYDGVEASWVAGYYASLSNRIVFYNDATSPSITQAQKTLDEYAEMVKNTRRDASDARRARQLDVAATLEQRAQQLDGHVRTERARIEGIQKSSAKAKAVHEAIHLISFNQGLQRRNHQYPFWLTEGMAESFETDHPNQAFGPDHANPQRDKELQKVMEENRVMPLEVLVQLNSVPGNDEEAAEVMYAQSASFFRWAFRFERDRLAGLMTDLNRERPGPVSPERQLALFTARFGDPLAVQKRWLRSLP